MNNIKWWHRIKLSDGTFTPGEVDYGPNGADWHKTRFGLSEELVSNKTVLDIGTYDGFFAFKAEELGATEVLATDYPFEESKNTLVAFDFAKQNLKSKVLYRNLNIIDSEEVRQLKQLGQFDIVLFYGVLYHLTEPLTGLRNACDLAKHTLIIETAHSTITNLPALEYRPGADNDPTNYFYPTFEFIRTVCEQKGFKTVKKIFDLDNHRMTVRADR